MPSFTPADFTDLVSNSFTSARVSFLKHGVYAETLMLVGPEGRTNIIVSEGRVCFRDGQDIVRRVISELHAFAAVHLGQFTARWNVQMAQELNLTEIGDMPSDLLMVSGYWPAQDLSIVKMAQLIPGPVPDVRDVSIPGMTATGWLSDLLPQGERSTS